jgi:arsenate reductase
MQEMGIDITTQHSKSFDDLTPSFIVKLDYVITLCAEEVCPTMVSRAKKLNWPFPDPAGKEDDDEVQLGRFRATRDALAAKIREFGTAQNVLPI